MAAFLKYSSIGSCSLHHVGSDLELIFIFSHSQMHFVPNAASVHIELFKSGKNEHYIQIFYRKSEEERLNPLKIPKCGEKCPLNEFYKLYGELIPGDFYSECKLS